MRIEELVLEGFKSYPVRTQITGWDSSFNAITGLNGSGKSNILDAICFVLGITNMSQMRAANQQDLIYKRGQAGITKASVTIVFDNSDRSKSPVGLEDCKQITVTRQISLPNVSKYLLNGHKALQQNIQTIFQSVQLNINNPNFVIMQGRITKVLNMRPQEILGMVEEAAGTRMFEERKDKALKTMAKKEKRVQEITSLLHEEITPKLEKLRSEKRAYITFQKTTTELERVGRVLRAWEWTDAQDRVIKKEREMKAKEAKAKELAAEITKLNKEVKAAEKEVVGVTKARDAESRKGGILAKLEEDVGELGKALVKIRTQMEIKEGMVKEENGKVQAEEAELAELKTSLEAKKAEVDKSNISYTTIKDKHNALTAKLTTAEELLQTLLTGLSSNGKAATTGGGYMGQLSDARSQFAQGQAEEEQARVKLAMTEKELKALEGRWRDVEREDRDGKAKLEKTRADIEACQRRVETCGWTDDMEQAGASRSRTLKDSIRALTEERDRAKQGLGKLDFTFSSPYPNFDRSRVKGPAAKLISLSEANYHTATALEIAAGGKLYNIIVQDEKVGKDLLTGGQLRKHVTMIPLNRIRAFRLSAQKLQAAQGIAPGKVHPALSLVGYADEVAEAIAFVFSDTIICDDAESAKNVTFSPQVGVRTVTLAGDVYEPGGTLSGGSAPSGSGMLVHVQKLLSVESRLGEAQRELEGIERDETNGRGKREEWKRLTKELDMKKHEMKLLEQQIEGSNAARIGTQIEELKKTIATLKESEKAAKDKQIAAKEECKKLERDMEEFKNNKDGKIDELRADISKQKQALQKHAVIMKTEHKEVQTATLEYEQIEKDIIQAKQNVDEVKSGVQKLKAEVGKLEDQVAKSEKSYETAEAKLQEERATLSRFDSELKELDQVIKLKNAAITEAELQQQNIAHEVQNLARERTGAQNSVANLERLHEWILEDKDQFGKKGTVYDFAAVDVSQLKIKATELEESQRGMKKKINPKVISMIDNVEKRDSSTRKMLATVMKDKEKIEDTITELDRYKRDALQKTWEKVDKDFGGIFAELLPGNFAKLQPPDGQDLMDGLEVKVQLGTVWKQSLTELSGGQRSLIALSLIMALLQFKPAPMYILDEIDAALDLSHTQHIGQLFRTRFKGSQFIVVSLKEGLFTNANVLFKARFRDGTSIVERTEQRSASGMYGPNQDDENTAQQHGRRRRLEPT